MSGAEAGFIIGLISGVISIIEAAKTVYDAAGNVKGQPEAFRQVAARLPLVIEILRCAEERVSSLDEPALDAIELILESCRAKADNLNKIFHKVIRKDDDKWFDRYKKALSTLRKGEKVESLMEGILKDTQLLACEKLVGIATEVQVKGLEEGIKEMAEMPSSLQEEIGSVTQNHNGSGNNNANTGGGAMHAGTGDLFHNKIGGDAYFGSNPLRQVINNYNNISSQQTDSQTRKYLKDLSTTDPREDKIRIEQAKGGLLKDSYCWILENPDFQQWRSDSQKPLLWIKGDPGKGKTMLLCGIIDEINKEKDPTALLSYFFCQATDPRLNNATSVIRGLIYLLVNQQPSLLSHIQKKYDEGAKNPFEGVNAWVALSKVFESLLEDSVCQSSTYLFVDALDECETDLPQLLNLITQSASKFPHVKWIVSSRNWPSIEEDLDNITSNVQLCLELNEDSISAAVHIYIEYKVNRLVREKKYDDKTRNDVQQHLSLNAESTFLWVALVCEELARLETRKWHIRKKLHDFPRGLDSLYKRMMEQVLESEDIDLCKQVLAVVSIVYRPVTLIELVFLSHLPENFKSDDAALRQIIKVCGSFLTIQDETIYFVHQSAKDFLLKEKTSRQIIPRGIQQEHHIIFSRSIEIMSLTLQRNIYGIEHPGTSINNIQRPKPDPLAPAYYSCVYWVDHLKDGNPKQNEEYNQDNEKIYDFLKIHLLHWLEAMSLMGKISEGIIVINSLESYVSPTEYPKLHDFIHDAKRFSLHYRTGIEQAPLQIYCSAIFFAPEESIIRKTFQECIPNWIYKISRTRSNWSAALQTLEGHLEPVISVAFSPDSKVVASGSDDKTIRFWDVATGESLQTFEGHSEPVMSVAFSPDGKVVASSSDDKTIRFWDVATGDSLQTLEGHSEPVRSVAFSPDGKVVASGSDDETIRLWDVATGDSLQTLEGHSEPVWSVAFSPDGKVVASSSDDETIRFWDVATGESLQTLKGHLDWVNSVAFSLDGKVVASGSGDKTIRLWDVATGESLQTLEGYSNYIYSVAFSPDSKVIASGSDDKTIRLWDVATGESLQTLKGHSSSIYSVAFSSDGKVVASGSDDKTIRLWDVATGESLQTLEGYSNYIYSVAFSPDSKVIASGSDDKTIRLWDVATGESLQTLKGHSSSIYSVAFSPDGKVVASGSDDKTIRLWDVATGESLQTLEGYSNYIYSVAFSPDSKVIASGSDDKTIRLWDVATGESLQTLEGHSSSIYSVAFSPDGKVVASGSRDKTIRLWDVATGESLQTLEGHSSYVRSVAFSPDGKVVASGSRDKTIRLWDVATGESLQTLKGYSSSIYSVAFSPDGKVVASGSDDKTIRLWDVATGDSLQTLEGHSGLEASSAFERYSISNHWIVEIVDGEMRNTIWLPPDYRPSSTSCYKGILALGVPSGRIFILKLEYESFTSSRSKQALV